MSFLDSLFRKSNKRRIYSDLLQLDDHLLRDIGLTRSDVYRMIADRGPHRSPSIRAHE